MRILPAVVLVGLPLVAASGCGPSIKGLRHDPSFTYESLTAGGIGIGGVTSLLATGEDPAAVASRLESSLRAALLDRGLNVVPAGFYYDALGGERYDVLLADYRRSGVQNEAALAEWAAVPDAPRYLVLSRVETDEIDQKSNESEEVVNGAKHQMLKLSTERTVHASFAVYDVTMSKPVWTALLADDETNSSSFDEGPVAPDDDKDKKKKDDKGFLGKVGDVLLGGLEDSVREYPPPPELTSVIGTVFKGFAKSLPEERS